MFCHKAIFCYAFPSTSFRINYHISLPPPPPPPPFFSKWMNCYILLLILLSSFQTPSNNAEPEGWFGSWILTSSPLHMAKTQRVKHKWPPWTDNIMITAWSSMTSGSTKHDHLFMAGIPACSECLSSSIEVVSTSLYSGGQHWALTKIACYRSNTPTVAFKWIQQKEMPQTATTTKATCPQYFSATSIHDMHTVLYII